MALGDGIRRNVATITQAERDRLRDAIRQLDLTRLYPDGVSFWDKQDQIHQATHVHGGPAFLPWHRELCNRFEALLREVDPDLSLHYWDWTTDPRASADGAGGTTDLFTAAFIGSASGRAGAPLESFDNNNVFAGSRDDTGDPADPPMLLSRNVAAGAPSAATIGPAFKSDADMIIAGDLLPTAQQYAAFRGALEDMHDVIHGYIGGNIGNPHRSFEDPFVFLLHSNVDRLFAMWQTQPGRAWRLDPNQVYGDEGSDPLVLENLEPWAGAVGMRPWAPPENEQVVKNSRHSSIVQPPCYDTLPTVPASVSLETPTLTFNDVPAGETTARAIVFAVTACGDVHFSITAGPTVTSGPAGTTFGTLLGPSIIVSHSASATPPRGRLWITYTGTAPGDIAAGSVTVHCDETGQDFVIPITANTIARPTVAVALSLDQSGSMAEPAGTSGATRIDVLKEAAVRFVELVQPNNGVGIVRFDHDAYPGIPVTQITGTSVFDPGRVTVLNAVQAHTVNPAGLTSIGDGVALARSTVAPVTGFDHKALIVFTDGLENQPQYIADVLGSIDNRTFAIGLGSETQVSTAALTALTNGTGGYVLLTGQLSSDINDYFRLTKYFLQILAGVTNTDVVLDPQGFIAPGVKLRLPFQLTDADIDSTVILLTDLPAVRFLLETPAGDRIDPGQAVALGDTFVVGTNMSYYRINLPVPLGAGAHGGVWHALLEVDDEIFRRQLSKLDNDRRAFERARAHGVRYSLNVHAYSNVRLAARASQTSLVPGATITLSATLAEYGIPVDRRASVRVECRRPDTTSTTIVLTETEPGVFTGAIVATMAGVYHFRFVADGVTLRGQPFTREQLATGAVFQGGDHPLPTGDGDPRGRDEQLCHLIDCILENDSVRRFLEEHKLEYEALAKCLRQFCHERLRQAPEGQASRNVFGTTEAPTLGSVLAQPGAEAMLARLVDEVRKRLP